MQRQLRHLAMFYVMMAHTSAMIDDFEQTRKLLNVVRVIILAMKLKYARCLGIACMYRVLTYCPLGLTCSPSNWLPAFFVCSPAPEMIRSLAKLGGALQASQSRALASMQRRKVGRPRSVRAAISKMGKRKF